jgi:vacuole morphology and inheritance protein 14
VILPKVSDKNENIKNKAIQCDKKLLNLLTGSQKEIAVKNILEVVTKDLAENTTISSQIACLNWLKLLLNSNYDIVMESLDSLLELLLRVLHDSTEDVVFFDLEVLALISTSEKNFTLFMSKLVHLFKMESKLLNKSGFIIRKLSIMLNPEKLYREIAKIILVETNYEFCSVFIQILNLVLLTSKELATLRSTIKSKNEKGIELFSYLFKSWCHNPISTLSLCLLSQSFREASDLVMSLTEFDINVSLFVQIDNLVQLFESPVFTELRLLLLEPHKNPYLLKTLYGLLMLLPQSSTYDKLAKRLECVPTMTLLQNHIKKDEGEPSPLISHFKTVQKKQFVSRLGDL